MSTSYEVVTETRSRQERVHPYTSETELRPGSVLVLSGRYWLVGELDGSRAIAAPARYRLVLKHPDGREEAGAFRRFRPGAPKVGHAFATAEEGQPIAWSVTEERLQRDESGEPYLELVAERDYEEVEELPDHELEHSLAAEEEVFPAAAQEALARAEEAGLAVELVALEPGEEPDWVAAARFIDSLVIEEIEDDLLELCGVNPNADRRDTWLPTVKERLRSDLDRFRADIEGAHDQIEEWDFLGGRVFAAVGTIEDEANPHTAHGWMCRLVDAEVLGAAGFARVRKAEL
jgi:hypothetical protein